MDNMDDAVSSIYNCIFNYSIYYDDVGLYWDYDYLLFGWRLW
jgi:hypothetical protein